MLLGRRGFILRRRGTGTESAAGEVEAEEPPGRFAFLVWMWKVGQRMTRREVASDLAILPMVYKKQQGWAPVELTPEEKSLFSAGQST